MFTVGTKQGRLIARLLEHSLGRSTSHIDEYTGELDEAASIIVYTGTAALAWRALDHLDSGSFPFVRELQQAYRMHALQAAIHDRDLAQLASFLKGVGLNPLLGKGWAVAQLYPDPALRPYGDFDLYVRPEDHAAATAAFAQPDAPRCPVDLHRGSAELDDRSFAEIFSRSQLVKRGEIEVQIFGPEDHLRLLCVHMLRHGAWRPLWLCDIAVALESRPADFDWGYFLSGEPRRSDWVACAIGLAHQLLGAKVEGTPVEQRSRRLPRWLVPAILKQWGTRRLPDGMLAPMVNHLRDPRGVLEALRLRWPNSIEATIRVGGRFNEVPRLPFQIRECLVRTMRFATQLPGLLRETAI